MIRTSLIILLLATAPGLGAQTGWAPLSREVERPYADALQRFGSEAHTAVRPYATTTLRAALPTDSLLPTAAWKKLDTWAGHRNGRKFRWGPLLEVTGGYEAGSYSGARFRGGAGFWSDLDLGSKLNFHVDLQGWGDRLPSYLDTLARATQLSTTVWRIKYVNLFAMMSDIRNAYGDWRNFHRKYASMHYLSWNATPRINLAVFEAIMWSAGDELYPRGFDVNYLNPVLFYRPTEFRIGSPDNALLGFAVNIKAGKHVLFYGQLMLDEFLMEQVRNRYGWYANKQAFQLGVNAYQVLGVEGLHLRGEFNFVRPFIYTHSDTRQNYAHMGQPLAHPYGSNVREGIVHGDLERGRWVYSVRASAAWLGNDSISSFGNNIFRPESERPANPLGGFQDYDFRMGRYGLSKLAQVELRAGWTIDPRSAMRLEASYTYRQLSPAWSPVETMHLVRLGLACHFREKHPEQTVRYVLR